MKHVSFIAALSMAALFFSCKKEVRTTVANQQSTASQKFSSTDPSATGNPYDSVGAWHNRGLAYTCARIDATGDTSMQGIMNFTAAFIRDSLHQVPSLSLATFQKITNDGDNNYSNIIAATPLSKEGKRQLNVLFSTISDTITMTNTAADYQVIKEKIIQFEDQVNADPLLTDADREMNLKAAAVGKYSAYYWIMNPPQNKLQVQSLRPMFMRLIRLLATVRADMGGLIGEGIGGAIDESTYWYKAVSLYM